MYNYVHVHVYKLCRVLELTSKNAEYADKVTSGHATDRTLRSLAWDVHDLPRLCEECRAIVVELKVVKERVEGPLDEYLSSNVPRKLVALRGRLSSIERGVPLLSHCCYSCICHHDKYRRASHQAIWPSCPVHTILQFHGWPVQTDNRWCRCRNA